MSNLKKLLLSQTIKDTLLIFVGLGISAFIGFIYTIVLARNLGPESFGIFSAVVALVAIVYSLGDLGLAPAIINLIPKKKDRENQIISTGFRITIYVSIVILFLFVMFSLFPWILIPGSIRDHFYLAGILTVNYLLINFLQAIFTSKRRFGMYSVTQVVDAVIKIFLVFIFLSASRLSISTALFANIISTVITAGYVFLKERFVKLSLFDGAIFQDLFSFGKWIAITKLFSVFVSRIDVLLLNIYSNSFQAGIFAAANRITLFFALLVSSLGSVVNPRYSGFSTKSEVTSYSKKLTGLISLISLFMFLCVLLADTIITYVFGDKYLLAIPVFQLLTLAMIPFMFTLITTPALIYTFNKPRFVAFVTSIQVVLMIILEIILIPKHGALAPPIAIGVSNLFVLAVSFVKLKYCLQKDNK